MTESRHRATKNTGMWWGGVYVTGAGTHRFPVLDFPRGGLGCLSKGRHLALPELLRSMARTKELGWGSWRPWRPAAGKGEPRRSELSSQVFQLSDPTLDTDLTTQRPDTDPCGTQDEVLAA